MSGRFLVGAWVFLAAAGLLAAEPLSREQIAASTRAYFAPMSCFSCWRMRMPDGLIREFSTTGDEQGKIDSVDGWTGTFKNDIVLVRTPEGQKPKLEWGFRNGTLEMLAVDGTAYGLEYPEPVIYENECPKSLWPEVSELKERDFAVRSIWKKGGRLRLWLDSPNRAGTFLSFFALAALAFALRCRRRWLRFALLAASVGFLVPLGMTDSRGALLGCVCGALPIALCACHRAGVSYRKMLLVAVGLMVVLSASYVGMKAISRRSYKRSDATRHQIIGALPKMFAASSAGWGRYGRVGHAYFDWYEPNLAINPRLNLVSDHMTRFVGYGWFGGGLYVFCWVGGLLFLLLLGLRGASTVPIALWTSLGVAATFNLIFSDWELWAVPLASLLLLMPNRPWKAVRPLCASAAIGLAASVFAVGGTLLAAKFQKPQLPSVVKEENRILVNGANPRIWIVDDLQTLGHVMTGKEIRLHYRKRPSAEAIGYVRRLVDLPSADRVQALVLAGARGREYLDSLAKKGYPATMPKAIVFLSPPFGPEAVPDELHERTAVTILIGEFAARYYREYAKPLPWVKVVAGAEQYIPGWMRYLVQ